MFNCLILHLNTRNFSSKMRTACLSYSFLGPMYLRGEYPPWIPPLDIPTPPDRPSPWKGPGSRDTHPSVDYTNTQELSGLPSWWISKMYSKIQFRSSYFNLVVRTSICLKELILQECSSD